MDTQADALEETELSRFRLPVSGCLVALRQPRGVEDLLLVETARTQQGDTSLALTLARRLARAVEAETIDLGSLSVTDLDALVLRLRQLLIGDRVRADVACPASGCGKRIDLDFSIERFLEHNAPRARRAPKPADEAGWFYLLPEGKRASDPEAERVRFRLPSAADQLAVIGRPDAAAELARRCIRPNDIPARLRRRAEAAMEALAPSLACDLEGRCPECGARVTVYFDGRGFCLHELRDRVAFIYQDVDVLARRYHWTEAEILQLPQRRRTAYAELARQLGGE
jgi:hypothetical protein